MGPIAMHFSSANFFVFTRSIGGSRERPNLGGLKDFRIGITTVRGINILKPSTTILNRVNLYTPPESLSPPPASHQTHQKMKLMRFDVLAPGCIVAWPLSEPLHHSPPLLGSRL
jgi:hypothetical protein